LTDAKEQTAVRGRLLNIGERAQYRKVVLKRGQIDWQGHSNANLEDYVFGIRSCKWWM